MVLRIDDSCPLGLCHQDVCANYIRDLACLGVQHEPVSWVSDYFPQILELALQAVRQGSAYCDKTPQAEMRDQIQHCIESEYHNNSIDENLRLIEQMKQGTGEGIACCVRARTRWSNPLSWMHRDNRWFRDPVLMRSQDAVHARLGARWLHKIFPTHEFALIVADSLQGITHVLTVY